MKQVNVKMVASPTGCRLVINGNIKHEAEIIDYETLFFHIQKEAQGPVVLNLHSEWTADLAEYDQDTQGLVTIPGDAIIASTDPDVVLEDEPDPEDVRQRLLEAEEDGE